MPFRKIIIKVVSDSFLYLLPKWVLQETALVAGSSPLIRLPPASARPLGLLPLGVSAPWTCATLLPFSWPEQGDSPNVCVLWNTYFWRLQTLWNLWSDIAKHWIVTLRYPPLRWYGTDDCHRDPMVNTEVIKMGKMPSIPYRFVQLFHNPVAKVMLCQTQE